MGVSSGQQGVLSNLEVDGLAAVLVERAEHVAGKSTSVSVGKEVSVDSFKLLDGQFSRRAVAVETLVPLFYFVSGEVGFLCEVGQLFRLQFAAVFAHI